MRPTKSILEQLLMGDASCLTQDVIFNINQIVVNLINKEPLNEVEQGTVDDILRMSNLIYNNTDRSVLILEDGIYDLLLEKYKKYDPNFQVGAEPVDFDNFVESNIKHQSTDDDLFIFRPRMNPNGMMFGEELNNASYCYLSKYEDTKKTNVSKRLRNTSHKYPKLVGTLHKAKFVLDVQAHEKGVLNDANVRIFERDFLRKHVQEGIVNPNNITLVLELKYDGVSVEGEVTDRILSARTRGDTQQDKASDLTPILGGYMFEGAKNYNITPFGMKFEAVISHQNLIRLSHETGKVYANPRNAIIGILGNSEARKYAKYITLVPLATSHDNMNRVEELEFMNRYYSSGEFCRYAVVSGNYEQVLYQVNKFVEEAENVRQFLPFMYDGVVVSYLDECIRQKLGRKNSINEYSIAIKFNTKKKLTRVRNITYTVGANGDITPMIHYDPVEFYGMINTKSSGHSYSRFMELGLRPNDVLEIEYVNDVIAYVRKADTEENFYNPLPPFKFLDCCPECGQPLVLSKTHKNMSCINMACKGRTVGRITNMMSKLGFSGFSEETVKTLGITSFTDLMTLTEENTKVLGPNASKTLLNAIDKFYNTKTPDYIILGSLGFSNIATQKWKTVLKTIPLHDIIMLGSMELSFRFFNIKGIGGETANTIMTERDFFMKDLQYIYNMPNVIFTSGDGSVDIKPKKVIRFSGVRDQELCMNLNAQGYDCNEGSVTKNTDILLIPYNGFESTKVSKAKSSGIKILTLDEFKLNMTSYLSEF